MASDLTIIAAGETVRVALDTEKALQEAGVSCRVINMHTIKPLDEEAIIRAARETGHIITVEEHSILRRTRRSSCRSSRPKSTRSDAYYRHSG